MQSIYDELSIEIFKYIQTPINLLVTNRKWHNISQDPHARAEWLIYKYGRPHALFHAIRLGNGFITIKVIHALLSKNAILSRYFIQRLLMHFGTYDEKLIKLEVEYNANQIDFDNALLKKLFSPWGSNINLPIFTKLVTEGYNILNDNELATKGNDMKLFHLLSAGPLDINHAPDKLRQNLNQIEDLILKKKFVPFPPRPKPKYEDTVEYIQSIQARAHEEYPSKDGYENSRQLNVVARAILIQPDLVNLWKEIGYYEICCDFNEYVMPRVFYMLFPSNTPNDWKYPDENAIVDRLTQLINLGFHLTSCIIEEVFHIFGLENKLNEIGDLLMASFQVILNVSKSEIASSCLIQAIKPERNLKETDLLEFLIQRIDNPKEALKSALDHYKVGFKFNAESIKKTKEIRSLTVHSNLYSWILKIYGPNSEATQKCFDDIIESRIWVDLKLQETPNRNIPEHITTSSFNSICSIYLKFVMKRFHSKRIFCNI